jgi:hypothetical protein
MSTTTSQKASSPPAAQSATAFGVTVAATGQQTAEKTPMSRNQKAIYCLAAIMLATAAVLYIQYHHTEVDPDAAAHPAVVEVAKAAETKDATGLIQFSKSDDMVVAQRAVRALGNLGNVDALQQTLDDARPEVRAEAISQIGDRADVSQLPVLAQYLQDPAPDVRIAAMRGVAAIKDFSIFEQLVPMLSDPDVNVRRNAMSAIEERTGQKFSGFDANNVGTSQQAITRINAMLPAFKKRFDSFNEIEAAKKKRG